MGRPRNLILISLALGTFPGSGSSPAVAVTLPPGGCPGEFENVGSLSERYERLNAETVEPPEFATLIPKSGPIADLHRQRINGVYKLLQDAFYPIVGKMNQSVSRLKNQEILALVNSLEKDTPVLRGTFAEHRISYLPKDGLERAQMRIFYPDIKIEAEPEKIVKGKVMQRSVGDVVRDNVEVGAKRTGFTTDVNFERDPTYLWTRPSQSMRDELGILHLQFSSVVTPIGQYGDDFAKKLLRTTQVMLKLVDEDPEIRALSEKTWENGSRLLQKETARGRGAYFEGGKDELVPKSAALEGILSLHQLFNTLLAKKLPGAPTGSEALRDLIFSEGNSGTGLISEATARMPLGLIGPTGVSGFHVANPLTRDAAGKLLLSTQFKTVMLNYSKESSAPKSRCPMSGLWERSGQDKTGLQQLAETYWRVFKIVDGAP